MYVADFLFFLLLFLFFVENLFMLTTTGGGELSTLEGFQAYAGIKSPTLGFKLASNRNSGKTYY
jgi:hypothetical protein